MESSTGVTMDRRRFVELTLLGGGAVMVGTLPGCRSALGPVTPSNPTLYSGRATIGPGNPILRQGPPGSIDDNKVGCAAVVKVGPGDYRMLYEAISSVPVSNYTTVAYATSPDGTVWTKQGRVIDAGSSGSYDDTCVSPCTVWRRPDGQLWLYAQVFDANNIQHYSVALYISASGSWTGPWTRYSGNPIIPRNPSGPSWCRGQILPDALIQLGDTLYLFLSGMDSGNAVTSYGVATSPSSDGINWTPYAGNPIFTAAAANWGCSSLRNNRAVLRDGDLFHCWYAGAVPKRLGYMYSSDGFTWIDGPTNPIADINSTPDCPSGCSDDIMSAFIDGNLIRFYGQCTDFTNPPNAMRAKAQFSVPYTPLQGISV